jgi:hypothetical protein
LHGPKAKYFSAESVQLTYSLYVYLRTNTLNHVICSNVCLWTTVHSPDARTSHLRTLSKINGAGLSAFPVRTNTEVPERAAHHTRVLKNVNTL